MDLKEMREKLEKAQSDLDRLKGREEQLLKSLEEEFECKSLEEAETLLGKISTEYDRKFKAHEKAKEDFMEKYKMED